MCECESVPSKAKAKRTGGTYVPTSCKPSSSSYLGYFRRDDGNQGTSIWAVHDDNLPRVLRWPFFNSHLGLVGHVYRSRSRVATTVVPDYQQKKGRSRNENGSSLWWRVQVTCRDRVRFSHQKLLDTLVATNRAIMNCVPVNNILRHAFRQGLLYLLFTWVYTALTLEVAWTFLLGL